MQRSSATIKTRKAQLTQRGTHISGARFTLDPLRTKSKLTDLSN